MRVSESKSRTAVGFEMLHGLRFGEFDDYAGKDALILHPPPRRILFSFRWPGCPSPPCLQQLPDVKAFVFIAARIDPHIP